MIINLDEIMIDKRKFILIYYFNYERKNRYFRENK